MVVARKKTSERLKENIFSHIIKKARKHRQKHKLDEIDSFENAIQNSHTRNTRTHSHTHSSSLAPNIMRAKFAKQIKSPIKREQKREKRPRVHINKNPSENIICEKNIRRRWEKGDVKLNGELFTEMIAGNLYLFDIFIVSVFALFLFLHFFLRRNKFGEKSHPKRIFAFFFFDKSLPI